jgi:hypothetical protein
VRVPAAEGAKALGELGLVLEHRLGDLVDHVVLDVRADRDQVVVGHELRRTVQPDERGGGIHRDDVGVGHDLLHGRDGFRVVGQRQVADATDRLVHFGDLGRLSAKPPSSACFP